jgi:PAS domain S-box-containing protein
MESEAYRQIVDGASDAIVVADVAGTIRYWNAGAEAMFGHGAAEAVGKSLDLIVPEAQRARHWDGYHRVMVEDELDRHRSEGVRAAADDGLPRATDIRHGE